MVATGFDSEYYRDDPRAAGIFTETQPVVETAESTVEQPVIETENSYGNDVDIAPETAANSDFTSTTNVNMWDNIRTDGVADDNDNDIPAILRRRKRK